MIALVPVLAPSDPLATNPADRLASPSPAHWFGTDHLGRDVLSRILYGASYSMAVGAAAIALGGSLGWLVGSLGGYFTGRVSTMFAGLIDVFLAFPIELVALAIVALLGGGLLNVILAIGLAVWPRIARVMRGEVLRLRELEYIEAARALGVRQWRASSGSTCGPTPWRRCW